MHILQDISQESWKVTRNIHKKNKEKPKPCLNCIRKLHKVVEFDKTYCRINSLTS